MMRKPVPNYWTMSLRGFPLHLGKFEIVLILRKYGDKKKFWLHDVQEREGEPLGFQQAYVRLYEQSSVDHYMNHFNRTLQYMDNVMNITAITMPVGYEPPVIHKGNTQDRINTLQEKMRNMKEQREVMNNQMTNLKESDNKEIIELKLSSLSKHKKFLKTRMRYLDRDQKLKEKKQIKKMRRTACQYKLPQFKFVPRIVRQMFKPISRAFPKVKPAIFDRILENTIRTRLMDLLADSTAKRAVAIKMYRQRYPTTTDEALVQKLHSLMNVSMFTMVQKFKFDESEESKAIGMNAKTSLPEPEHPPAEGASDDVQANDNENNDLETNNDFEIDNELETNNDLETDQGLEGNDDFEPDNGLETNNGFETNDDFGNDNGFSENDDFVIDKGFETGQFQESSVDNFNDDMAYFDGGGDWNDS